MNAIKTRGSVDRVANTTKVNCDSSNIPSLAVSKSFYSDAHSLRQAIQNTSERVSLLEAVAGAMDIQSLGLHSKSISTVKKALNAQEKIDSIVKKLAHVRGELGVTQNSLIRTVKTLNVTIENLSAADSTVRETNIAAKVAMLTQNQIHSTASVAKTG